MISFRKKRVWGIFAIAGLIAAFCTLGFSSGDDRMPWWHFHSGPDTPGCLGIYNSGTGDGIMAAADHGAAIHAIDNLAGTALWCEGPSQFDGNVVVTCDQLGDEEEAALITFGTSIDSIKTRGLVVNSPGLDLKGTQTGVLAETSIDANLHPQKGSAQGILAFVNGWDAAGELSGVQGYTTVEQLDNFNAGSTSYGLGGRFEAEAPTSLDLNLIGTYWVGGVYGEVAGTINTTPSSGAVAGVIGVDNSDGTAESYAAYFDGVLRMKGAIKLDPVSEPSTPSSGFVLYVDSVDSKLKAKSSLGNVTELADP